MSRLTERKNGEIYLKETGYKPCGDVCKSMGDYDRPCDLCPIDEAFKKLAQYEDLEDLEEQGRLVKLPCAVGDMVWFVGNELVNDYEVRRYIVDETGIDCIQVAKEIDGKDYWNSFSIYDFGKTVFPTKEEAEAKLAEM